MHRASLEPLSGLDIPTPKKWQPSNIDSDLSSNTLQMAYNIDVPKTNVPEALEILVDSVVNPKFLSWEVKDAVEKMETDLKAVKDNPQTLLMEVRLFLHAARI